MPRGIYFNNPENKHNFTLNDSNFDEIQNIVN